MRFIDTNIRTCRDYCFSRVIERIWVREVVDDTWESFRWRRLVMKISPSMFEYATGLSGWCSHKITAPKARRPGLVK
jgi:hypothetical protein